MVYIEIENKNYFKNIKYLCSLFFKNTKIELLSDFDKIREEDLLLKIKYLSNNSSKLLKIVMVKNNQDLETSNKPIFLNSEDTYSKSVLSKMIQKELYKLLSKYTNKTLSWGVLNGIRPSKIVRKLISQNMSKEKIIKTLQNEHFVGDNKANLLYEIVKVQKPIISQFTKKDISLYIGIPFCPSRCLYCSFTSFSVLKYMPKMDLYFEALALEIKKVSEIINQLGLTIKTIYVGGGTPTSISNKYLKDLLSLIKNNFDLSRLLEYTIECGRPDSINKEKLLTIKEYGITRISINPQTMNKHILKLIGRNHSPEDIENSFNLARSIGFYNINMDIIAGLPNDTIEGFNNTLLKISKLNPESITIHCMALKRASDLSSKINMYNMPTSEDVNEMVNIGMKRVKPLGMTPYYLYRQKNSLGNLENIGYSKEGFENIYNIQMIEETQTIIGLGAGATSRIVDPESLNISRIFNLKGVEEYQERILELLDRKNSLLT